MMTPHEHSVSVAMEVVAERDRHRNEEGWTPEHDDRHDDGSLAAAAASYAYKASRPANDLRFGIGSPPPMWPGWATRWWKPKNRRRDLIRAASLIFAEIETLDRAKARDCKLCDGTGYVDWAHLALDPCSHQAGGGSETAGGAE